MQSKSPRLAARAVILHENRLLLVNAYGGQKSDLWCAPGGGIDPGQSIPDNLTREVKEEVGLEITIGTPCLINEFHDPDSGFHQVDLYFRCSLTAGADVHINDPEGIVNRHIWARQEDMATLRHKPDSLVDVAWGNTPLRYDPLELIVP